jgi:CheY-like chemotaxis protein
MALDALSTPIELNTVIDGEKLIAYLADNQKKLPDVLFLDLNMPRKNGFECLTEIRQDESLNDLTIIIFSTSYEQEVAHQLFVNGAKYFIRKPAEFSQFKTIIEKTVQLILNKEKPTPIPENFVLTLQNNLFK